MHRLICAFVVHIWHKQVFSWRGSYEFCPVNIFELSACLRSKSQWQIMKLKAKLLVNFKFPLPGSFTPNHNHKDFVLLAYKTRFSAIFTCSGYFHLIPGGVRQPRAWRQDVIDVVDGSWTEHFLIKMYLFQRKIEKITHTQTWIQSTKEEYARKRIYNGCSVRIENSKFRHSE